MSTVSLEGVLFKWIAAVLACMMFAVLPVRAEAFPSKPVRIVVPFPPGGGSDTVARVIGKKLQEMWGQSVIIENKGGAQGSIGTAYGVKLPPDGYAITLVVQGALAINPHLQGKDVGFDVQKDMIPLVRATEQAYVMVSRVDLPVNNLRELVELAKRTPGKLSLGTSASGPQLVGELLKQTTGIDLLNVPYNGGGPATQAILGGHVDLLISNPGGVMQHIRSGRVRGIAVLGDARNPQIPDVANALEQKFVQLSDIPEWYGFVLPAGTPSVIVRKLNADFVTALKDPDVQERIRAGGATPSPSTPEEFAKQISVDYARWGNVIKSAGLMTR